MKKVIFIGIGMILLMFLFNSRSGDPLNQPVEEERSKDSLEQVDTEDFNGELSKGIFVSYWNTNLDEETLQSYDELYYFGITAHSQGVDRSEAGFQNLDGFISQTEGKQRYLVLRLLDSEVIQAMFEDTALQTRIIADTVSIAQEYGFSGVVLDLEVGLLSLGVAESDITKFVQTLSQELQNANLSFKTLIYGDVFYRGRPYDVGKIGELSDEIMIMAYDFSKSYGEPGPNFPLDGEEEYGYDFRLLISEFSQRVSQEKLRVIFGMFGYNWILGQQGLPLKRAEAMSLNDIRAFQGQCTSCTSCTTGTENCLQYKDEEGYTHKIWYESEESVEVKIQFLRDEGVGKVGYWTYGYY